MGWIRHMNSSAVCPPSHPHLALHHWQKQYFMQITCKGSRSLLTLAVLKVETNSIWQQELLMSLSWEFSLQNTNLIFSMLKWFCASAFLFCMPNIQISYLVPFSHNKFYSYNNTTCSMCHKPGKSREGFLGWCLHLCFKSTPFEGKVNRKIKLEMWVSNLQPSICRPNFSYSNYS